MDNEDEDDDEGDGDEDDEEEVSVVFSKASMFLNTVAKYIDRVDHANERAEIQEINISMWKRK